MKIINCCIKTKCDIGGCKNLAEFSVIPPNASARGQLHLCKNCVENLYKVFAQALVPKSPQNFIKRLEVQRGKSL